MGRGNHKFSATSRPYGIWKKLLTEPNRARNTGQQVMRHIEKEARNCLYDKIGNLQSLCAPVRYRDI